MKIAVIGTGIVGKTISAKLMTLGYDVMIGTRNVKDTLSGTEPDRYGNPGFGEWIKNHSSAKLGTVADAVGFGEIVINVTLGAHSLDMLKLADPVDFKDKVVIDISNPLDFSRGMPPSLIPELSNTNSLAEEIQRTFPGARVVKTLNTMSCYVMVNPGLLGNNNHINFICGNDPGAKNRVKDLLIEFGWTNKQLFDLGDLTVARTTEAMLPLWVRILMNKQSAAFNFSIVG